MSLGREYATEMAIGLELARDSIASDAELGIWTTKDGRRLNVRDMTTAHIRNSINLIEEMDKLDLFLPWISVFKKELERRGEEL